MPVFVKLPSGLFLNLALVRRVAPNEKDGQAALRVYFADDDFTNLDSADSDTLGKHLGSGRVLSSNIKTAIFWIVILLAVALVWTTVRR
jgi:hypothetical protein